MMDPELSKIETWLRLGYPLKDNMVLGDWVFRASVEPAEVEGFSAEVKDGDKTFWLWGVKVTQTGLSK